MQATVEGEEMEVEDLVCGRGVRVLVGGMVVVAGWG